ncbi:MAG TPA: sigma 54-interacting transcriptional regulator [bacterium]|jgi:hypothetical protein
MRFRQVETVKRTTNDSLLPVKVTYEDTTPVVEEDEEEEVEYSSGIVDRARQVKDAIAERLFGSSYDDEEEEDDEDEGEEESCFDVRFYDRASPEPKSRKKSDDEVFCFDGYVLTPGLARAIKAVAPHAIFNEPILIEGAEGTGKDTLAHSIHQCSGLSGPFITVDCGSYRPDMFEDELHGTRTRVGLIDQAEGGVLYLKDIDKLTVPMQEILLAELESLLVSDDEEEEVDDEDEESEEEAQDESEEEPTTQLIACCSPRIKTLLSRRRFSQELYTSLKVGYAALPSLLDHPNAILPLLKLFVNAAESKRSGTTKTRKAPTAIDQYSYAKDVRATLTRLKWPGNYDDLIRCAERVRQEVTEKPGPITGAMIKRCLTGPTKSQAKKGTRAVERSTASPTPSSTAKPGLVGHSEAQVSESPTSIGKKPPINQLIKTSHPMIVIVPDKQLGPVSGVSMSRAWTQQHETEYQQLRLDDREWENTVRAVEQAARALCNSMFSGKSGVLKRALKDNWKGEFKRVLIARWVILAMEKHECDQATRLHRLGWLEEPKPGKDYQKKCESYRQYCYQLGFVQPKQGNVLERSFVWPEEQAWLDDYIPPR